MLIKVGVFFVLYLDTVSAVGSGLVRQILFCFDTDQNDHVFWCSIHPRFQMDVFT